MDKFNSDYKTQILALAERLKGLATARGLTAATAESCTGGMIAAAITAVAGSSEYFYGGIVSYDNSIKSGLLKVPPQILNTVGAVSLECAEAMCRGAASACGTDIAVSVTGVAGPGGGSEEKPVGTVWFGLCVHGKTQTWLKHFDGDRSSVRAQAAVFALELLCKAAEQ